MNPNTPAAVGRVHYAELVVAQIASFNESRLEEAHRTAEQESELTTWARVC